MLIEQPNMRIHLIATIMVISLSAYLKIEKVEWIALVIVIMIVWVAEGLNTALEYLCDKISPDIDPLIKKSKDVAAASVLFCALGALVVGIIIFSDYH